jgi:hypothetical protein
VPTFTPEEIEERRRVEDILRGCGREHEWLEYKETINRGMVRALLSEAREAGITIREVSRMTGLSTQTLHTWLRQHMRPVPAAHFGLGDPPAHNLEEAALRTIAEAPDRDWSPSDVVEAIPDDWPNGSAAEVDAALETLTRGHFIWDGEEGHYRLAPPPGTN